MSNNNNNNNNNTNGAGGDTNGNNNGRPVRRSIRGPQSALTDFLASQNISAAQIRADADTRRAAAAAANNAQSASAEGSNTTDNATASSSRRSRAPPGNRDVETKKHRSQKQQMVIDKIKNSKAYKKRKRDADESDSDDLADALFREKATPMPGQMENCEICSKRFTVTPYSRAGPNGGLLCPKCSKEMAKDDNAAKKKKPKASHPGGGGRRKLQSSILDGTYQVGAKNLMTLCIETLAKNINLADDLGELTPQLIDKIARILSKLRLLNPQTLNLFLQPTAEEVRVYDGAKLGSDDYIRILSTVSSLKVLKLRNAVQFQNNVMEYLIGRNFNLQDIYLHGANLLSDATWQEYLTAKGEHLQSLRVYYTDRHIGDNFMASLPEKCKNLTRLKVYHNQEVTDTGLAHAAKLEHLEHLGLDLRQMTSTMPYVEIINAIGRQLRTFSITRVSEVDDRLLDALHEQTKSLSKLRITESEVMTDAGFARLFNNWKNKPLTFADFSKCCYVDASRPRENPHMVGLCGDGFRALMKHSGESLKHLNVHACRHISKEAFEEVFGDGKSYPSIQNLEISFCEQVTDFIVGCIFRSCPNIKQLNVFGCMKVKDVAVPKGKILVGVPNAVGMVTEGTE